MDTTQSRSLITSDLTSTTNYQGDTTLHSKTSADLREQIRQDFLLSQLIERDAALQATLADIRDLLAQLATMDRVPVTLNGKQVAAMLHVKPGTVANWVSRGKIPFRRANGAVFFVLDDLMNWSKPQTEKDTGHLTIAILGEDQSSGG